MELSGYCISSQLREPGLKSYATIANLGLVVHLSLVQFMNMNHEYRPGYRQ